MIDLDAYFHRIGYAGPREPTLDTLRALHLRHPVAIPFESLDVLLGRPIRLDLPSLEQKLVRDRRGGYCFEQNVLFQHVLAALGFETTALAARVLWDRDDDGSRARTHMLLLVRFDGRVHVADVGFGGLTMTAPLALEPGVEQRTPHEAFRIRQALDEYTVEALIRGAAKPLYRFDLQPQREIDIEVLNYFVATHPESPFRTGLMAARPAGDRRYALRDNRFSIHRLTGETEQRDLESIADLCEVLTNTFGIALPKEREVDAALDRLIG
jgi:N-hydroxyarylamine O-acetyltransferase